MPDDKMSERTMEEIRGDIKFWEEQVVQARLAMDNAEAELAAAERILEEYRAQLTDQPSEA